MGQARRLGRVVGHAAVEQDAGQLVFRERVEPEDAAPRDDRVELRLGRPPDQDQDRSGRRLLQGLEEGIGRLVVEVVGVVDDRDLATSPRRFQPEFEAEFADLADREFMLVLGAGDPVDVRMRPADDLDARRADATRASFSSGTRSQSRAWAKTLANDRLPIPSGPTKRKAWGNRPCSRPRRRASTARS